MPTVYLIGAGVIARLHAAAAAKLPADWRLAVTDPNPQAIVEFSRQFPHAQAYPTMQAMLATPAHNHDIVVNATPPLAHCQPTIDALNSGRHVLCEKPLALNLDNARRMLAAARARQRLLGCCSTRVIGTKAAAEARHLLRSGAIGDVYHVTWVHRNQRARSGIEYQPESRWFIEMSKSGGGTIMDWGPYDLAALVELLEPERVEVHRAWLANPATAIDPPVSDPVEQHAGALMVFFLRNGTNVPVTWERSAATHGREQKTHEVEGTTGALTWEWLKGGTLSHTFDDGGKLAARLTEHPDDPQLGMHDRPLHYFHLAVIGKPSPALVNERALFNFHCLRNLRLCPNRQAAGGPSRID